MAELGVATVKEMIDLAASIRDEVNEHVFVFAWSAALIQRPDARSLRAPPIWEVFPDKFVGINIFQIKADIFSLRHSLYNLFANA